MNDDLSKRELNAKTTTYKLRDLWLKKDVGDTKNLCRQRSPHTMFWCCDLINKFISEEVALSNDLVSLVLFSHHTNSAAYDVSVYPMAGRSDAAHIFSTCSTFVAPGITVVNLGVIEYPSKGPLR